jgi:endoglucanase
VFQPADGSQPTDGIEDPILQGSFIMRKTLLALDVAMLALLVGACGGDRTAPGAGGTAGTASGGQSSGGAQGTGGGSARATGAGGALGTGGGAGSPSGGAPAAGGTTATGGQRASGGMTGSGGRLGTGGTTGTGGQTASGGIPGSGGNTTGGPDAGARGSGGTTGTGGSSGAGGGGATGQLTPQEAVKLMSPGWNLGNSFDAIPNETSWGNPTPTQTLIKAVHAAGFKLLRLSVGWTDHIGPGPSYTIDSAWMNKVKQTAQWAIDDGMYVFVNTHHDSDGGNGGWVSFPSTTSAAQTVATEVTAVWTQIANAFKSFDGKLMFECFNEPNYTAGRSTQAETDLNMYLEACFKAIRDTGGANATRIVMIQPIGASPIQAGIQNIQKVSFINNPNLVISLHTYYPTNFGLSTTPYSWGSASDYTNMQNSIAKEIRVWLPTQVIFIGEWGSMAAQPAANRAAHAQAYAQDTTTAGIVPIWWDNGGSGSESFALFNRSTGAVTQSAIVSGLMTGVKNGLASPNNWATKP